MSHTLLLAVAVQLLASVAMASEPGSANAVGSTGLPTSPAFEALGVTPSSVLRPSSIRELGVDLTTGIGTGGLKPGLALEAAPLWLWLGRDTTLAKWRESRAQRAISRFAISFASQELDDGRLAVAEGLRFAIWDDSDPRFDESLEKCLQDVAKSTFPTGAPQDPLGEAGKPASFGDAPAGAAVCRARNVEQARKKKDLQMAVAAAAVQEADSSGANVEGRSFDAWISASYAMSRSQVLVASARANRDLQANVNSGTLGLSARLGGVETLFALDVSGTLRREAGGESSGQWVVSATFEQQVAEAIWVTASSGTRVGGTVDANQHLFVTIGLKLDSTAFPLMHRQL